MTGKGIPEGEHYPSEDIGEKHGINRIKTEQEVAWFDCRVDGR